MALLITRPRPPRRGRPLLGVIALATVIVGSALPIQAQSGEELRLALERACQAQMQRLQTAEAENAADIDWQVTSAHVRGTYIGYARDFTCKRVTGDVPTPTAQLNYQEVVYEKSGSTARAARNAQPRPTEIRNVTVVLVYQDGGWR